MPSMSDDHSVDFLEVQEEAPVAYKQRPQLFERILRTGVLTAGFIVFALTLAFTYGILSTQAPATFAKQHPLPFLQPFKSLSIAGESLLIGQEDGRINVLLLGIGGFGHAGPELTDTIIFASADTNTGDVGMLSIPRDTYVDIPGTGYSKINSVNAYAELASPGSGPAATAAVVGEILDEPIHYTVKIDFNGFEDLINAIGGVDVYVERTFTDPLYPTDDDLTQSVTFEQGWQHMNGETALIYARSRHGNNGEGSDFARAARQQKVILAAKDELLSAGTLLSPGKINKVIGTIQNNVTTDLTFWEMVKLAGLIPNFHTEDVRLTVLDTAPGGPLYGSNIGGAYVILPRDESWSELQEIADNLLLSEEEKTAIPAQPPAKVEIQNGTAITGLAFETSLLLDESGYSIESIGNTERRLQTTTIYDFSGGIKSTELARLAEFLNAETVTDKEGWTFLQDLIPGRVENLDDMRTEATEDIDFLIILGEDAEDIIR